MIMHIKDLTPDPQNARRHTPRNTGMIERALNEVGAARSIVVDENGVVLAGNATIEAAAAAGIERVQVVDADGQTIVAVRRTGLTPEQKTQLALYDNRTAELAEWDTSVLAELGASIDLSDMWTRDELTALIEAEVVPDVDFREYDESTADDVKYCTCPSCGHRFPL
jgi:ParB-like chromosome segregation protein Spo0J